MSPMQMNLLHASFSVFFLKKTEIFLTEYTVRVSQKNFTTLQIVNIQKQNSRSQSVSGKKRGKTKTIYELS